VAQISLEMLIEKIKTKKAGGGVRETAALIGISPATLSRVERGNLPDLETFRKICAWVEVDPGEVLGFRPARRDAATEVRVHFKKGNTLEPQTAKALAELILIAQQQLVREEEI
jgi:transcriptional regulator with XRE-family HTH domain